MSAPRPGFRRGTTLVEVMIAGMLLSFLAIVLFEGAAFSARLAKENADYLVADAFAFDLAWKRFHEDYAKLKALQGMTIVETLTATAVPALCNASGNNPPTARTTIAWVKDRTGADDPTALALTVDVSWGPADNRRQRSVTVCKSERGQEDVK